jgi:hypothetical protein
VPISPRPPTGLVAGTHRLHPDPSINFQLNRWVAWTGGRALADIRRIALVVRHPVKSLGVVYDGDSSLMSFRR